MPEQRQSLFLRNHNVPTSHMVAVDAFLKEAVQQMCLIEVEHLRSTQPGMRIIAHEPDADGVGGRSEAEIQALIDTFVENIRVLFFRSLLRTGIKVQNTPVTMQDVRSSNTLRTLRGTMIPVRSLRNINTVLDTLDYRPGARRRIMGNHLHYVVGRGTANFIPCLPHRRIPIVRDNNIERITVAHLVRHPVTQHLNSRLSGDVVAETLRRMAVESSMETPSVTPTVPCYLIPQETLDDHVYRVRRNATLVYRKNLYPEYTNSSTYPRILSTWALSSQRNTLFGRVGSTYMEADVSLSMAQTLVHTLLNIVLPSDDVDSDAINRLMNCCATNSTACSYVSRMIGLLLYAQQAFPLLIALVPDADLEQGRRVLRRYMLEWIDMTAYNIGQDYVLESSYTNSVVRDASAVSMLLNGNISNNVPVFTVLKDRRFRVRMELPFNIYNDRFFNVLKQRVTRVNGLWL